MGHRNASATSAVKRLFNTYIDAGLRGRFEEASALLDDSYTGIGIGETGLVTSRAEAKSLIKNGFTILNAQNIKHTVAYMNLNFVTDDVAVVVGKVSISGTGRQGEDLSSGFYETLCAKRIDADWKIISTHTSPMVLTANSSQLYPIHFRPFSLENASTLTETVLYAQVNLSINAVLKIEYRTNDLAIRPRAHTLEELARCGLYGEPTPEDEEEYHAFLSRLRLLGLYAEGVSSDRFDYEMRVGRDFIRMRVTVDMSLGADGEDVQVHVTYTRLNGKESTLEQFAHRASHDALTGILNRDGFENLATELLQDYNPKFNTALFMIDLDDFKQINDRLGHQTGDTVLHEVALELKKAFRDHHAVGRVGGDEFMAILTGEFTSHFLKKKCNELLTSMKLQVGGSKQIPVSVSIGVAYGKSRATFDKMYKIADRAMYTSKRNGKCRYHLINADTNTEHSYTENGTNLLSLQSLLDYTDGRELSQNKTPYEALLENIPGGVITLEVTDSAVKLTHCNDWFGKLVDYSDSEIAQMQANDTYVFVHPEDVQIVSDMIDGVRNGLDSVNIIYRVRHRDGKYTHIAMAASSTEQRHGETILCGIETDVDEVVRLKQDVEKAHRKLDKIIRTIPGCVMILTLGDEIQLTHLNEWTSRYTGFSMQEIAKLQEKDPFALAHPDDRAAVENKVKQLREGCDKVDLTLRLMKKDGSYAHVQINATMTERTEHVAVFHAIETDVETLFSLKQEVETARAELQTLINTIPGGVLIITLDDSVHLKHCNDWLANFLGFTAQEISKTEGRDALSLLHPDDLASVQSAANRMRHGLASINLTYRLRMKHGSYRRVCLSASLTERDGDVSKYYGIVTDLEKLDRT